MDLKPLWTFYNVAKHKSFSLTAEKLFVTQPLVSTRVKQLEDRYKVKLIERSRRKIKLTDDGEILFSYAEKIFNLVKEADNHLEDVKKLNYGHLKISAGLTLGTYFLPPLLAAFRKKYPHIEIHMKVRNKQEVIGDILSQTDDFGFIGYMEPDGKLELTPVLRFAIARRYKRLILMAEEALEKTVTDRGRKVIKDANERYETDGNHN